ncbi:MAG TPA: TetR-like C-terminal domain-containing protein [Gemmatimonadales bacterium]|nr:TetR-like C-terminal domain-containing protein [Gemmatimonadales bacterium]
MARDLGVVSSAVYCYVANRDELLTLLLVDAYSELGDAMDTAVNALPEGDFDGRFRALGRAVRTWVLREPARYGLLFGSPVPGYQAPAGQTTPPGTRVISRPDRHSRRRLPGRCADGDGAHRRRTFRLVRRPGGDPQRTRARHAVRAPGERGPRVDVALRGREF